MSTLITNEERDLIRFAMRQPLLEPECEISLARRWHESGDEDALHGLTRAHLRLAVSAAKRFRHYGLPNSDLIQEGIVGLMQAAARFDPDRDVRFSTYAGWWIRSSIQDFVLRNWSIVRTGTTAAQKKLFFNLRRIRANINDFDDGHIKMANKVQIAEHLRLNIRDVENMSVRIFGTDRSLNAPATLAGEGETREWQDLLADNAPPIAESIMNKRDNERRALWLSEALSVLSSREAEIIQARILSENIQTLDALGQQMGISKERVRQIESQALEKMRRALIRLVGDPEKAGLIPDR